jgi:hypothetical protein
VSGAGETGEIVRAVATEQGVDGGGDEGVGFSE